MGRYLSVVALGFAAALSAGLLPHFAAFVKALAGNFTVIEGGARGQPGLVLLLVVCWSVRAPLAEALIWALVGGIALDLLSILPLGASSAALALIAFAVNSLGRHLLRLRYAFLLAAAALATLFMTAWSVAGLALLGATYDLQALVRLVLLPTLLYNMAAVLPLYGFVRIAQRRLESGLTVAPQTWSMGGAQE